MKKLATIIFIIIGVCGLIIVLLIVTYFKARTYRIDQKPIVYINTKGEIISQRLNYGYNFSEGLARVSVDADTQAVIDTHGDIVFYTPDYPELQILRDYHNGLALIKERPNGVYGQAGFIDGTGKIVIKPQFDDVGDFVDGLAPAKQGERIGFINTAGEFVIDDPDAFSSIDLTIHPTILQEGDLVRFYENGKYGYRNQAGETVIAPQFGWESQDFSEGLAMVQLLPPTWARPWLWLRDLPINLRASTLITH